MYFHENPSTYGHFFREKKEVSPYKKSQQASAILRKVFVILHLPVDSLDSEYKWKKIESLTQLYAESGAFANFGALNIYFSRVIFLYNALGKRKAESPTAFFGGESGTEHVRNVFLTDSLSCVRDFDYGLRGGVFHMKGDGALLSAHRVDGVLAEVFDDPFEQGGVDSYTNIMVGEVLYHADVYQE